MMRSSSLIVLAVLFLFVNSAYPQGKEEVKSPSPLELKAIEELNKGAELMRKGDYREAIVILKKAIDLNPDFSEAYYNVGISYEQLGKHKDAIEMFKKTIELTPDDANAYYALGYAYYQKRKYKQAIDAFENTVTLKPNNAFAFRKLGSAYLKVGEKDKAREQYQVLKQLDNQLSDELFREISND